MKSPWDQYFGEWNSQEIPVFFFLMVLQWFQVSFFIIIIINPSLNALIFHGKCHGEIHTELPWCYTLRRPAATRPWRAHGVAQGATAAGCGIRWHPRSSPITSLGDPGTKHDVLTSTYYIYCIYIYRYILSYILLSYLISYYIIPNYIICVNVEIQTQTDLR